MNNKHTSITVALLTLVMTFMEMTALGVYFGTVYVKTRNLWIPIILHLIINLCGIPFCFSTSNEYPTIVLVACVSSYLLLGIYSVRIVQKKN